MSTPLGKYEKSGITQVVKYAKHSDVTIVVDGDDNRITVREGRSRLSLNLPGYQLNLVKIVDKTGTPTIVVLINGRLLSINRIYAHDHPILNGWFPNDIQILYQNRLWHVIPGIFDVMIGNSTVDIRLHGSFRIDRPLFNLAK